MSRREYHAKWYAANRVSKREKNKAWQKENPLHYWASMVVASARPRAKRVGVPFGITAQDILAKYPEDGLCPVLGFVMTPNNGAANKQHSPSLDRIIPERGYVKNNIAVISVKANTMKCNASLPEIKALAVWLEKQLTEEVA